MQWSVHAPDPGSGAPCPFGVGDLGAQPLLEEIEPESVSLPADLAGVSVVWKPWDPRRRRGNVLLLKAGHGGRCVFLTVSGTKKTRIPGIVDELVPVLPKALAWTP